MKIIPEWKRLVKLSKHGAFSGITFIWYAERQLVMRTEFDIYVLLL
jgi:hypothetical protein